MTQWTRCLSVDPCVPVIQLACIQRGQSFDLVQVEPSGPIEVDPDPVPSASIARVDGVGCSSAVVRCAIDGPLIQSLRQNRWLSQAAVDLLFHCAVEKLQRRGLSTARVVPSAVFGWWLTWAARETSAAAQVPNLLRETDFRHVDYVLIPWFQQNHYSTIIITNLRTPSCLSAVHVHRPVCYMSCQRSCASLDM